MVKIKCFKCGFVWEIECAPCVKEAVCLECGALNVLPDMSDGDEIEGDWLQCIEPTGFEWSLPSGKLGNPISGYTYVDAHGNYLTKDGYIAKYKIDPDLALEYMRKNQGVRVNKK